MWNILQKPLSRSIRCLRWTVTGRSRTHSPATPSPTTAAARASNTDILTAASFTPTSKRTPNTSQWLPRTSWDAASRRLLECRSEKQIVFVCKLMYKAFMWGNAIFTLCVDISPKINFCHHLFTRMLFQTSMTLHYSFFKRRYFERCLCVLVHTMKANGFQCYFGSHLNLLYGQKQSLKYLL